jgi:uncharacterized protein YceK
VVFTGQNQENAPVRPIPVLLAVALLSGCATIDASRSLAAAEVALEGARAAGAEKQAPYEYAAADLYFQKAREENGHARYGDAAEHAQRAATLAEAAKAKATGATPRAEEK